MYVTDASQSVVHHRVVDHEKYRKQVRELTALIRRFTREADEVAQQYRDAFGELTSRDNWKRLYQL